MTPLSYENLFDLLVLLLLIAAFILGYIQGTVRRLLGIAGVVFALLLSAQLVKPVGTFLASNWVQFPVDYTLMLAWALTFVVLWIVITAAIEMFYERSPILPRYPRADHIIGGILGVVEAGILVGIFILILDPYFRGIGVDVHQNEIYPLRDLDHAMDVSQTARIYRQDLIPAFLLLVGGLMPAGVRTVFPR